MLWSTMRGQGRARFRRSRQSLGMMSLQESKVRLTAKRLGLTLQKSRVRNEMAPSFGNHRLPDAFDNRVVFVAHPFDHSMQLDEVEKWLTDNISEPFD